jgi:hypothetical protein
VQAVQTTNADGNSIASPLISLTDLDQGFIEARRLLRSCVFPRDYLCMDFDVPIETKLNVHAKAQRKRVTKKAQNMLTLRRRSTTLSRARFQLRPDFLLRLSDLCAFTLKFDWASGH